LLEALEIGKEEVQNNLPPVMRGSASKFKVPSKSRNWPLQNPCGAAGLELDKSKGKQYSNLRLPLIVLSCSRQVHLIYDEQHLLFCFACLMS